MLDVYLKPYWKFGKEQWKSRVRRLGSTYFHDHATAMWSVKTVTTWQVGPFVLQHDGDDRETMFIEEPRLAGYDNEWITRKL